MRIAILHDYFNTKGGGERLVLMLAKHLNADIYTAFIDKKKTYDLKDYKITALMNKAPKNNALRILKSMNAFSKLKLDYDLYILSGTQATAAAKNLKPNIWYCHTPPRHVYSQKNWYMKNIPLLEKLALKLYIPHQRKKDQENVKQVEKIVVNSKNVQKRVKKYYNRKSEIVYPPIDTKFKHKKDGDYYLSFARVSPLKRVKKVVEAFTKMPDKKLIVASSGEEIAKIKKIATKNITIKGFVSEKELQNLVGSCIATIYIPVDEDFGMSPLEGNAAGKPCIGVNEGGLKETIKHKKTGYLMKANPKAKDIIQAVNWMTPEIAKMMKERCVRRAKEFSAKRFLQGMDEEIGKIK